MEQDTPAVELSDQDRILLLFGYLGPLAIVALVQVGLGITTLLLRVPVVMGVLHQLGAVLVLTAALLALSALQTTNGRRTSPAVVDRGAALPVSSP